MPITTQTEAAHAREAWLHPLTFIIDWDIVFGMDDNDKDDDGDDDNDAEDAC